MKRIVLLLLSAAMAIPAAKAQVTYTQADVLLDTAVHHYNALKDYTQKLQPASLTDDVMRNVEVTSARLVEELEAIIAMKVQPQSDVAQYFHAMTNYERGFIQGMKGNNASALSSLQPISAYMNAQSTSTFPKRYLYDGKNYSISWDNFAPTLHEYYTGLAEIYINLSRPEDALPYAIKGMQVEYTNVAVDGLWYRYISASKYIQATKSLNRFPADAFETAINFLNWLADLDAEYKKAIADNNFPTQATGYEYLIIITDANASFNTGENWARAGYAMQKLQDDVKSSSCFHRAADLGYSDSYFITNAYALARAQSDHNLGLKICAIEERNISESDCNAWSRLSENWKYFGDNTKAEEATNRAESCERLAVEAQKAYEREQKKQERRENIDFSMYAGFYPLPLLTIQTNYWDYGAVAGIGFLKTQIEASYKIINRNRVMYDDLFFAEIDVPEQQVFWDGYRAHLAFKFGDRDQYGEGFYAGPLFEIVERSMSGIKSTVYDEATGNYVGDFSFSPHEKAYNLMFNYGVHVEENHVMADMFFGIGATYVQFSTGEQGYATTEYLFSDPLLEYRKETRFGPMVRMGITVGLSTRD